MNAKKIVIVGGVAGGASCAARARRLNEDAEIVVFERGPYVSFANCGLPYHVGGDIPERKKLILQTPEAFLAKHRIDVRVEHEVLHIDRAARCVQVRNVKTGVEYSEPYEALVLSMGAAPLRPPIPGIDQPGHFTLRNIPDMDAILAWIDAKKARRAVVLGGGYIGLEMAEQLRHRGLDVSLVDIALQVLAPVDPEMAAILHEEMRTHGIGLHLGVGAAKFDAPRAGEQALASVVELTNGTRLAADVVILGLGVKPEVGLARDAGLDIGQRGGIRVDDRMATNDPAIFAVGDAVEVRDTNTGEWALIPLAGPANRQGRIVADQLNGVDSRYAGTQGTAILRLFKLAAGCTGANEKTLKRLGRAYRAVHLHPGSHAGYFPGAKPIALKLLFDPTNGRVLGAQAIGEDGIDKRIDVIATAIKARMTVDDLAELELAYAPPFGSAKDPVNLAGMVAQNILRGLVDVAQWSDVPAEGATEGPVVLDVRERGEVDAGAIPGSIRIPLGELRGRLGELPRDRELIVHCASGQRSYNAVRLLLQKGFKARNLSGSWRTWRAARGK